MAASLEWFGPRRVLRGRANRPKKRTHGSQSNRPSTPWDLVRVICHENTKTRKHETSPHVPYVFVLSWLCRVCETGAVERWDLPSIPVLLPAVVHRPDEGRLSRGRPDSSCDPSRPSRHLLKPCSGEMKQVFPARRGRRRCSAQSACYGRRLRAERGGPFAATRCAFDSGFVRGVRL